MRRAALKMTKKATNISLPVDVYTDAKALGINISQVCEESLREVVATAKQQRWTVENAEFIAEYNKRIEMEGTLLQEWRSF
ncbi:MAG: type II toxin-antitoxin system CcdA family antitoxin [Burkholderiales bacterium]|nr:type II toxin-antitoxin system CcdA family antitoxin [Burkholderiales bacterium]